MEDISQLSQKFASESPKNQLKLIPQLAAMGESSWEFLMEFLSSQSSEPANLVTGKIYQVLYEAKTARTQQFLETYFPTGVVPLDSERKIDYQPLQQLLALVSLNLIIRTIVYLMASGA